MKKKKIFVVHHHFARHEHFDFRIEVGRVLKSWAIPKKPPLKPSTKRLAIQVEDHSLSYATFKGRIPEGQYGAGIVKIWDKGTYDLIEKTPNKYEVNLHGKKLKGVYLLTNFEFAGKNKWLFYKKKEPVKKTVKKVKKKKVKKKVTKKKTVKKEEKSSK